MESFIFEVCMLGYDLSRIKEEELFIIEKTLHFDLSAWADKNNLCLERIRFKTDMTKRPGVELNIYCNGSYDKNIFISNEITFRTITATTLQPVLKKYFDLNSIRFNQLLIKKSTVMEDLQKKETTSMATFTPVDRKVEDIINEVKDKFFRNLPIDESFDFQSVAQKMLFLDQAQRQAAVADACFLAQKRESASVSSDDVILAIEHLLSKDGNIEATDNDIARLAEQFTAFVPTYDFERLIITDKAQEEIRLALVTLNPTTLEKYTSWGLLQLDKHPRSVLNFYGPPGTGKTMAAQAIAKRFNKRIIFANCHSLQSKWHGESSKNVKAVFYAAAQSDSILFFDEADSLISQRLEEVNSGSEDEINNMRNTILTCLEEHTGIVIFASNFVKRYDFAFETRIQSVLFPMPDEKMLLKIWEVHLPKSIPGVGYIDLDKLAKKSFELGFCGRDVKNAVIRASKIAIADTKEKLSIDDILNSVQYISDTREEVHNNLEPARKKAHTKEDSPKNLSEIIAEQQHDLLNNFLGSIAREDDFDICEFNNKVSFLNDKEIKQIVSKACQIAFADGRNKLASKDLLAAYDIFRPQKAEDDAYNTLIDAIQAIIDKQ